MASRPHSQQRLPRLTQSRWYEGKAVPSTAPSLETYDFKQRRFLERRLSGGDDVPRLGELLTSLERRFLALEAAYAEVPPALRRARSASLPELVPEFELRHSASAQQFSVQRQSSPGLLNLATEETEDGEEETEAFVRSFKLSAKRGPAAALIQSWVRMLRRRTKFARWRLRRRRLKLESLMYWFCMVRSATIRRRSVRRRYMLLWHREVRDAVRTRELVAQMMKTTEPSNAIVGMFARIETKLSRQRRAQGSSVESCSKEPKRDTLGASEERFAMMATMADERRKRNSLGAWQRYIRSVNRERAMASAHLQRFARLSFDPRTRKLWFGERVLLIIKMWHRYSSFVRSMREGQPLRKHSEVIPEWNLFVRRFHEGVALSKKAALLGPKVRLRRFLLRWVRFVSNKLEGRRKHALALEQYQIVRMRGVLKHWAAQSRRRGRAMRILRLHLEAWENWAKTKARLRELKRFVRASVLRHTKRKIVRAWAETRRMHETIRLAAIQRLLDPEGACRAHHVLHAWAGINAAQSALWRCWLQWKNFVSRRKLWVLARFQYHRRMARHLERVCFLAWRDATQHPELDIAAASIDASAELRHLIDLRRGQHAEDETDEENLRFLVRAQTLRCCHRSQTADADGNSELHHAADEGSLEDVTRLLRSGADPNARNSAGETPLHRAARHFSHVFIAVSVNLIEAGSVVDAVDDGGNSPISLATNPTVRAMLRRHQRRIQRCQFTSLERKRYRELRLMQWTGPDHAESPEGPSLVSLWRFVSRLLVKRRSQQQQEWAEWWSLRGREKIEQLATSSQLPPSQHMLLQLLHQSAEVYLQAKGLAAGASLAAQQEDRMADLRKRMQRRMERDSQLIRNAEIRSNLAEYQALHPERSFNVECAPVRQGLSDSEEEEADTGQEIAGRASGESAERGSGIKRVKRRRRKGKTRKALSKIKRRALIAAKLGATEGLAAATESNNVSSSSDQAPAVSSIMGPVSISSMDVSVSGIELITQTYRSPSIPLPLSSETEVMRLRVSYYQHELKPSDGQREFERGRLLAAAEGATEEVGSVWKLSAALLGKELEDLTREAGELEAQRHRIDVRVSELHEQVQLAAETIVSVGAERKVVAAEIASDAESFTASRRRLESKCGKHNAKAAGLDTSVEQLTEEYEKARGALRSREAALVSVVKSDTDCNDHDLAQREEAMEKASLHILQLEQEISAVKCSVAEERELVSLAQQEIQLLQIERGNKANELVARIELIEQRLCPLRDEHGALEARHSRAKKAAEQVAKRTIEVASVRRAIEAKIEEAEANFRALAQELDESPQQRAHFSNFALSNKGDAQQGSLQELSSASCSENYADDDNAPEAIDKMPNLLRSTDESSTYGGVSAVTPSSAFDDALLPRGFSTEIEVADKLAIASADAELQEAAAAALAEAIVKETKSGAPGSSFGTTEAYTDVAPTMPSTIATKNEGGETTSQANLVSGARANIEANVEHQAAMSSPEFDVVTEEEAPLLDDSKKAFEIATPSVFETFKNGRPSRVADSEHGAVVQVVENAGPQAETSPASLPPPIMNAMPLEVASISEPHVPANETSEMIGRQLNSTPPNSELATVRDKQGIEVLTGPPAEHNTKSCSEVISDQVQQAHTLASTTELHDHSSNEESSSAQKTIPGSNASGNKAVASATGGPTPKPGSESRSPTNVESDPTLSSVTMETAGGVENVDEKTAATDAEVNATAATLPSLEINSSDDLATMNSSMKNETQRLDELSSVLVSAPQGVTEGNAEMDPSLSSDTPANTSVDQESREPNEIISNIDSNWRSAGIQIKVAEDKPKPNLKRYPARMPSTGASDAVLEAPLPADHPDAVLIRAEVLAETEYVDHVIERKELRVVKECGAPVRELYEDSMDIVFGGRVTSNASGEDFPRHFSAGLAAPKSATNVGDDGLACDLVSSSSQEDNGALAVGKSDELENEEITRHSLSDPEAADQRTPDSDHIEPRKNNGYTNDDDSEEDDGIGCFFFGNFTTSSDTPIAAVVGTGNSYVGNLVRGDLPVVHWRQSNGDGNNSVIDSSTLAFPVSVSLRKINAKEGDPFLSMARQNQANFLSNDDECDGNSTDEGENKAENESDVNGDDPTEDDPTEDDPAEGESQDGYFLVESNAERNDSASSKLSIRPDHALGDHGIDERSVSDHPGEVEVKQTAEDQDSDRRSDRLRCEAEFSHQVELEAATLQNLDLVGRREDTIDYGRDDEWVGIDIPSMGAKLEPQRSASRIDHVSRHPSHESDHAAAASHPVRPNAGMDTTPVEDSAALGADKEYWIARKLEEQRRLSDAFPVPAEAIFTRPPEPSVKSPSSRASFRSGDTRRASFEAPARQKRSAQQLSRHLQTNLGNNNYVQLTTSLHVPQRAVTAKRCDTPLVRQPTLVQSAGLLLPAGMARTASCPMSTHHVSFNSLSERTIDLATSEAPVGAKARRRRPATAGSGRIKSLPPVKQLGSGSRSSLSVVGYASKMEDGGDDGAKQRDVAAKESHALRYRPSGRHALRPLQPPVRRNGPVESALLVARHPAASTSAELLPSEQRSQPSVRMAAASSFAGALATSEADAPRELQLHLEGDPYVLEPSLWSDIANEEDSRDRRNEREALWSRFAQRPLSDATRDAYAVLYPSLDV